jgi:hypothetical protein
MNFTGSRFRPKSMSVSSFSNPFFKLSANLEIDGTFHMNQVCNFCKNALHWLLLDCKLNRNNLYDAIRLFTYKV